MKNNNAEVSTPLPHREGQGGGSSSLTDRQGCGSFIDSRLESRGVKPTSTRLLVYRALAEHHHPMSLRELDDVLDTVDRSSIFRTLTLFLENHLVHAIEDGSGMAKYELCEGHDDCSLDDQHVHFYCLRCQRTFCFHSMHIPHLEMPEGFVAEGVTFLVKGVCPNCARMPYPKEYLA